MRISRDNIVKREAHVIETFEAALKSGRTPTVTMAQDALKALDGKAMRPGRVVELLQVVTAQVSQADSTDVFVEN